MTSIQVSALSKNFGEVKAVSELSFRVGDGEVVGLLGANGAGKTTAMRMILGLLAPSAGGVTIGGRMVTDVDRREMGYVPQSLGLYRDLTVEENLGFVAAAFGVEPPVLEPDLRVVGTRRVGELSLGLQRRVAFAAARSHHPGALILDEPTSGVGPLGRARLWEMIRDTAQDGASVLVSTHYMEEAEECDRVVLLAGGRQVATGAVAEVIGGIRSVSVHGALAEDDLALLREAGGTVLHSGTGWRVVGTGVDEVRRAVGPGVEVDEVPASFEEAFVALSR